jgi:hypothetical protein
MELFEEFLTITRTVVWASLASVDSRGRPRSRVVHPLWEAGSDGAPPVGWVTTRRTTTKVRHLAGTPYLSVSYWSPAHDTAVAECRAGWVDDEAVLHHVWTLAATTPEPLGFDPATMYAGDPTGGDFAVLALTPWQLQVRTLKDLAAGRRPRTWREPEATERTA